MDGWRDDFEKGRVDRYAKALRKRLYEGPAGEIVSAKALKPYKPRYACRTEVKPVQLKGERKQQGEGVETGPSVLIIVCLYAIRDALNKGKWH